MFSDQLIIHRQVESTRIEYVVGRRKTRKTLKNHNYKIFKIDEYH